MPDFPTLSASPSLTAHNAEAGRGPQTPQPSAEKPPNTLAGDSFGGKRPQNATLRNYSSLSGGAETSEATMLDHANLNANVLAIANIKALESKIRVLTNKQNATGENVPQFTQAEANELKDLQDSHKNAFTNLSPLQRAVFVTKENNVDKLDESQVTKLLDELKKQTPKNGDPGLKGDNGKVGPGVWAGVGSGLGAALLGYGGLALYQKSTNDKQNQKLESIANSLQQAQPQ